MAHSNTITIDETDGITCLNLLTINGGEIFVLIVTEHSFLCSIGQGGDSNAAMLATHITVISRNLDICLGGVALATNNILTFFEKIGLVFKYQTDIVLLRHFFWGNQLCGSIVTTRQLRSSAIYSRFFRSIVSFSL